MKINDVFLRLRAGILLSLFVCMASGIISCDKKEALKEKMTKLRQEYPELPTPEEYDKKTLKYSVLVTTLKGEHIKVWIYKPKQSSFTKTPCIFIAPAGSHLFDGNTLSEGDIPEHVPYVHQGYTVVSYEIPGVLPERKSNGEYDPWEFNKALQRFRDDEAGYISAETAMDYVFRKAAWIDTTMLFTAGHSSAATHALHLVSRDKRFKAAIAYAPTVDVESRLGKEVIDDIARAIPSYPTFIQRFSPMQNIDKLSCPVFLFYAEDDSNSNTNDIEIYAEKLRTANMSVILSTVKTGEHYDSMIDEGIPLGIQWLDSLCGKATK